MSKLRNLGAFKKGKEINDLEVISRRCDMQKNNKFYDKKYRKQVKEKLRRLIKLKKLKKIKIQPLGELQS